jgi:hypothetical protein
VKTLSIILAIALCAASVVNAQKQDKTKPKIGDISNPEAEIPPFVGMTKAQALARYGRPKKNTITDEGEQWVYILNMGEVIGKAFIPFNFKPTIPRTGVLTFGPDGKVKKFTWDSTKHG